MKKKQRVIFELTKKNLPNFIFLASIVQYVASIYFAINFYANHNVFDRV